MKAKSTLLVAAGLFIAMASQAQFRDANHDRKEIRQDKREDLPGPKRYSNGQGPWLYWVHGNMIAGNFLGTGTNSTAIVGKESMTVGISTAVHGKKYCF